jgi:hypothetical protein
LGWSTATGTHANGQQRNAFTGCRPDSLLEMLFDRMPMGIAVIDRAFCIQRYNPTWQDYSERYAPPDGASLRPALATSTICPAPNRLSFRCISACWLAKPFARRMCGWS